MNANHVFYQLNYVSIYATRRAGFEPATISLEGYCSIQLSYRRNSILSRSGVEPPPLDFQSNALPLSYPERRMMGFEPTTNGTTNHYSTIELHSHKIRIVGLEPTNVEIKTQCLTTWLHPFRGRWDLNPRLLA
jgi:hypothetical protein